VKLAISIFLSKTPRFARNAQTLKYDHYEVSITSGTPTAMERAIDYGSGMKRK